MLLLGDALIELEPRSTAITSSSSPESRLDQLRIIAKSRREHRITAIMAGREREREKERERERERRLRFAGITARIDPRANLLAQDESARLLAELSTSA
jgi:hypothetical protein